MEICFISGLKCVNEIIAEQPANLPPVFSTLQIPGKTRTEVACPTDPSGHVWRCGTYKGTIHIQVPNIQGKLGDCVPIIKRTSPKLT